MATIKEIKQQAATIKNATQVGENTAERVGGVLEGLSDIAQQQEDKLSDLAVKDEDGTPIFSSPFQYIQNEEFVFAMVDAEDRFLFGIQADGSVEWQKGVPAPIKAKLQEIIDQCLMDKTDLNEAINAAKEELEAFVASVADTKVDKEDGKSLIDSEVAAAHSVIDNPEYLAVETDADGKVLSATYADGSHYLHNVKSETIPEEFEHIEDPEGRMEITTDADGKVLSYRDSKGVKYETNMQVDNLNVSNLNLQGNSVQNIEDALKANGFSSKSPTDWSESSFIQIYEPRLAIANITGITTMPTTKTQNMHAWMEFWDMQGNYFKKRIIINAQGNSSLGMPKKNFACDFCNDEWIGDDTFKMKFGNWVIQDSFHFKAYYADFFKGVSIVGYKLFNQIENTRDFISNRGWKRALLPSEDAIGYNTTGMKDVEDINLLLDNGARCYPDGFPCLVYLNGDFYGVFSWALKKHRDNYMQSKSKAEHIQLDGTIYDLFKYNGAIDWDVISGKKADSSENLDGIEVRNPKSLICIDGTKYDGDNNRQELIDSNSHTYSSSNQSHVLSGKVKSYITDLSTYIPQLEEMASQGKTNEEIKAKLQDFFDVDGLIDYIIFNDITCNTDGLRKNWQWLTYNGSKWFVFPYDLDGIFGWNGWAEVSPTIDRLGDDLKIPTGWIIKYFGEELDERYKVLRGNLLTKDNIFGFLVDWCERIGVDNLKKDLEKYPQTPALYPIYTKEHHDNIYRVSNWISARLLKCDDIYNYKK